MVDQKGATHLNISHLTLSATGHFVCKTILYPPNESSRKIIIKKKHFGEMRKGQRFFFLFYFCFRKAHPHHSYLSTDIIDFHKASGLIYPPFFIVQTPFRQVMHWHDQFFIKISFSHPNAISFLFSNFFYFICTRINRNSHE